MAYYLGIDGGGSKTKCAVGDETSVLATVTAGPSNITRVGEARARESLHQAIREACAAAKIDPRQLRHACIGAAGAGREEIAAVVRRIVADVIPGDVDVVGDMQIAMEAALGAGPGAIVIAGTGSIAYGRDAKGRTARAGGWGFAISDEGSAHWIGRAAVGTLLRAADGPSNDAHDKLEATPLFRQLTGAWSVDSIEELARTANSGADFAVLFPAVLSAASSGDALAQRVLERAGSELARLAATVLLQLFPEDKSSAPMIPMAMTGGVFRHSQVVRDVFGDEIRKLDPRVQVEPEIVDPVVGALQMARSAAERE